MYLTVYLCSLVIYARLLDFIYCVIFDFLEKQQTFCFGKQVFKREHKEFCLVRERSFYSWNCIFLYAELFIGNETYREKTDVVRCVDLFLATLNFVLVLENVSAVSWFCTVSLCSYSFLLQLSSLLHSCVSLSSSMHVLQLFLDPINYLTWQKILKQIPHTQDNSANDSWW